jgi:hypothetical protein
MPGVNTDEVDADVDGEDAPSGHCENTNPERGLPPCQVKRTDSSGPGKRAKNAAR